MPPPRLDSAAGFAALLGNEEGGRWQIASCGQVVTICRGYRSVTLILETELDTAVGSIRI